MDEQELELRPAQFNDRFIAYLLDVVPFLVGWIATLYIVWVRIAKEPPTPESAQRLGLLWLVLMVLYQFAGNLMGGTVGKKLMGLTVISRAGAKLGLIGSLVRAVFWVVSVPFFNFGFLIALLHPESRALHDIASGSLVVEQRAKHPAEGWILFFAAALSCIALTGGGVAWQLSQPLPSDLMAIEKAQEGLQILAAIEEKHKAETGHYTDKLGELARASGDVSSFKDSMGKIFVADQFHLETDLRGYRISAAARDRKKTRVEISGP